MSYKALLYDLVYNGAIIPDRELIRSLTDNLNLLTIEGNLVVYTDQAAAEVTERTTFYATSANQLKALEGCKKIEKILSELMTIWTGSGLRQNTLISVPGDHFIGLINISTENEVTISHEAVRFIE
jgi:hypothetical protein